MTGGLLRLLEVLVLVRVDDVVSQHVVHELQLVAVEPAASDIFLQLEGVDLTRAAVLAGLLLMGGVLLAIVGCLAQPVFVDKPPVGNDSLRSGACLQQSIPAMSTVFRLFKSLCLEWCIRRLVFNQVGRG